LLILAVGSLGFLVSLPDKSGKYDALAQCVADSGAVFYGAFWCPTCQRQKTEFGKSSSLLPYEECSTPDQKGQLQICKDKNVVRYPTWEFASGERVEGALSREDLATKTSCEATLVQQ
jgi:hypothetical protein